MLSALSREVMLCTQCAQAPLSEASVRGWSSECAFVAYRGRAAHEYYTYRPLANSTN